MKAIVVNEEQHLIWSNVPDPVVTEGEVLVEIHCAALNRADLLQRRGKYPPPPGCPDWMGLEIAGIVRKATPEAASLGGWREGDRVCALLGGGGYAQYANVRYDMIMPIPRGLGMEEAAALPEAFATSYLNLFIEGGLQPGQTAYIPAGASGLASVAIPMAKVFGARVITSVLSQEIALKIGHLGADRVIISAREDTPEILRLEAAAGRPVHVAMDCLGGADLGRCLPHMAAGGRWILISTLAGIDSTIALRPLLTKGIRLSGSMLRNRTPEEKAQILKQLIRKVWPKIEAGDIRPTLFRTLPIEQAEQAHCILEHGQNIGKVVLIIRK